MDNIEGLLIVNTELSVENLKSELPNDPAVKDGFFGFVIITTTFQDEYVVVLCPTACYYYSAFKIIEKWIKGDNFVKDVVLYRYDKSSIPEAGIYNYKEVHIYDTIINSIIHKDNILNQN